MSMNLEKRLATRAYRPHLACDQFLYGPWAKSGFYACSQL